MFDNYNRFFIGVDNGVTGTIAIIGYNPTKGLSLYNFKIPSKVQQNYTKKKSNITRIDGKVLMNVFQKSIPVGSDVRVMIERPMVNPTRFQSTISAVRALEAVQTIIETLGYSYEFVDSKEWQRQLLPKECKGEFLKSASLDVAQRLYPNRLVSGHPDADGLLIAHYCLLKYK